MSEPPDLTPAELAALARKHGLREPLERLPSAGIVNRVYANPEAVLRVAVPGDETGEEDARTEAVTVPAVLRAGIRTPPLLAFDDERDVVDVPVTMYARVPAPSLHGTASTARAGTWPIPGPSGPRGKPGEFAPGCTSRWARFPTPTAGWRSGACRTPAGGWRPRPSPVASTA